MDIFTQTRSRIDEHEQALTGVDDRTHIPGTEQTYRGVLQVMRDTLADAENLAISLHPVAADAFALGIRVGLLDSALHSIEDIGKPPPTADHWRALLAAVEAMDETATDALDAIKAQIERNQP